MTKKTIWIGLGTLASLIIAIGSFVAAAETLGIDRFLPVTRGELVEKISVTEQDVREQKLFWVEQYRQQLRQNEFDRRRWEKENPHVFPPVIFDQQRSILEQRIKKLEKEGLE